MSTDEAMTPPAGFMEELDALGMQPGWKKREPQMWPMPKRTFVPAVWRAAAARDALQRSTTFVSPEFAERRNVILANPMPGNSYPSCATMVAAYQLVLAGETARTHRHTPNALRIVLESGEGMVTLVNGMAVDMAVGDVVLTPQWHWHGHLNGSDTAGFWIDILDVPLVQKLENIFFEHHPDDLEIARGNAPDSPLRIRGTEVIANVREGGGMDIGDNQLPTMRLQILGYTGADRDFFEPEISNRIFVVMEGRVGLTTDATGPMVLSHGDVAVVPSWTRFDIGAEGGGVVLEVSDAPVFDRLGFRDPAGIVFR